MLNTNIFSYENNSDWHDEPNTDKDVSASDNYSSSEEFENPKTYSRDSG